MENPNLAAIKRFTFQKRLKKMPLHQRANLADHKQKPKEKNSMHAMISQCETNGKNSHI